MDNMTLEKYKKEFENFPAPHDNECWTVENLERYERLANDCISDYPDDELGYTNLGIAIGISIYKGRYEKDMYYDILELAKSNYKYASTLENIFKHSGGDGDWVYSARIPYDTAFKNVYSEMGYYAIFLGSYGDAAKFYYTAQTLGIDYHTFIQAINPPICDISVPKFLCMEDIKITNISNIKEIYFVGENGVGKTLLLQTIIRTINQNDHIIDQEEIAPNLEVFIEGEWNKNPHNYENIFAYGTARFRTGSSTDENFDKKGYMTLFDRHKLLINPIQWFKDVLLRETQSESPLKIDSVLRTFEDIIDFDNTKSFRIERSGSKFSFFEQNTLIEFEHLAEGYRSVLIWLCDLVSRLTENQPYTEKLEDFYGIVLVDEIDMFLHPKWEYSIVRKLREKLPNIQWFFTTHSPVLILGASPDAVFYKLYKKDGVTKISEQWKCSDIDNLLSNALLTSPLFDMDTARMQSFAKSGKELDTGVDYLESRLRINLNQRKAEIGYVERREIDEMISKAIDELINVD